ncbi:MAG: BamA/TamA family outer membrane protein, partial [Amylibacter sp.]
ASTALIAINPGAMASVTDSSIRASVGVSVIWDSPFGPIRFDYAEPIMSKPWDKTRSFNFGASTRF